MEKVSKTKSTFVNLIIVLGFLFFFWKLVLVAQDKNAHFHSQSESAAQKQSTLLYFPSPIEERVLQSPQIWPRHFSPEKPLTPLQLPHFYSLIQREEIFVGLNAEDSELARKWSVWANAKHLDRLKEEVEKFALSKDCSLISQEAQFRLYEFASGKKRDELRLSLRRCQPDSLSTLWREAEAALRLKDKKNVLLLKERFELFSKKSPPSSWESYFASELLKILAEALSSL